MIAHDVFICHSSEDGIIAQQVCDQLEAAGILCWIAPRDPVPGVPWGGQIVEAIESTKFVLLVFSANANASAHVLSELELAFSRRKTIVPFRIESIVPGKDLEFFIQGVHWFDAFVPPFESRVEALTAYLQHELSGSGGAPHPKPSLPDTGGFPVTPPDSPPPTPLPHDGLRWRTILLWYAGAVAVAALGSYLAYGPLTSDSWHRWAVWTGVNVVFLDVSRVLMAGALALFALHNLDVIPNLASKRRPINGLRLQRYEKVMLGLFAALLVFAAYYRLPKNFEHDYDVLIRTGYVAPAVPDPLSFGQIFGPYYPYSLYVIGLWIGIVLPVLMFFIRSIRNDREAYEKTRRVLDVVVPDTAITRATVARYVIAANDVFALLKEMAGRYVPLFLAVITVTLVEELTPLKRSVLEASADFGKLLLWMLWLPSFGFAVGLFSVVYDSEVKHAKNTLSLLIARLQDMPAKSRELADATKALREIGDRETSVKAMADIAKMGSVGVYALVVVVFSVALSVLFYHENWARAFVPQSIIDWFTKAAGLKH